MNYATATSGILGWVSGGSTPLNISSSFRAKYYTETCRVIPDFLPLSFSHRWIKVCTAVSRVCVLYRQRRFLTSKQTTTPHCWPGYMLSVEIRGLAPTLFSMPLPPPKKIACSPYLAFYFWLFSTPNKLCSLRNCGIVVRPYRRRWLHPRSVHSAPTIYNSTEEHR